MRRPFWTEKDKKARKVEDEKARGCFSEALGCGGEGCLGLAIPMLLIAAFWYFG